MKSVPWQSILFLMLCCLRVWRSLVSNIDFDFDLVRCYISRGSWCWRTFLCNHNANIQKKLFVQQVWAGCSALAHPVSAAWEVNGEQQIHKLDWLWDWYVWSNTKGQQVFCYWKILTCTNFTCWLQIWKVFSSNTYRIFLAIAEQRITLSSLTNMLKAF